MKKLIIALVLFAVVITCGCVHAAKISSFVKDVEASNSEIYTAAGAGDWQTVSRLLGEVSKQLEDNRIWTGFTIPTDDIEELEVSLQQSIEYANIQDAEGFAGEFAMFRYLMSCMPGHEGFDIKEIL